MFLAGVEPRVSLVMSHFPSPHVVKGQLMALSCLWASSLMMGASLTEKAKAETKIKARMMSLFICDRLLIIFDGVK